MSMNDSIADMLTRIRNGIMARFEEVQVPFSKLKENMAVVLEKEGYIRGYEKKVGKTNQSFLNIYLKYKDNKSVIWGLKRISKPSCRVYVRYDRIPKVLNGLGVSILSTSEGVLSDEVARRKKVGGEILCTVW